MNTETKDITYYKALPYTVRLNKDEDGDIVARIEELTGCVAHGCTEAEALKNLKEVHHLWIETRLKAGLEIPEPTKEEALPSGKWIQRVPRSLHQKLTRVAKREQVSLNQLVTSILSEGVERREFSEFGRHLIAQLKTLLTDHHQMATRSVHDLYRQRIPPAWHLGPEMTVPFRIASAARKTLEMGVVPQKNEIHYKQHAEQKETTAHCH